MKKIKIDSLVAYSFIGALILQSVPFSLADSFDFFEAPFLFLFIPFYGYLLYHIVQSERAFKMFAFLLLMNYNGVYAIGVGMLVFCLYVYKFCQPIVANYSSKDGGLAFLNDPAGVCEALPDVVPRKFLKNKVDYL